MEVKRYQPRRSSLARKKLIMGNLSSTMLMERKFAAIAFIGQHARANSPGGVMAHSYSSLGIQNMLMNGKPVGEIETRAALAGWFKTPVTFLAEIRRRRGNRTPSYRELRLRS